MKKVSVVVPVYNGESFIERSLKSFLGQKFDSFEIIVVDDGSEDRTHEVVKKLFEEYRSSDTPTKLIRQQNMGESVARNTGIRNASGKYIAFIDADDLIREEYLAKLFEKAEETHADIVFCGYDEVSEKGDITQPYTEFFRYLDNPIDGIAATSLLLKKRIRIVIGNALYRSSFIRANSLSFRPGCPYGPDIEFTTRSLFLAETVASVNEPLFNYVRRSDSVHSTRTSRELFHLIGVRRRIREFFSAKGAPEDLIRRMDTISIPKTYIKTFTYLIQEGKSNRMIKKLLEYPEIRRVLNNYLLSTELKRSRAFLLKHAPLLFIKYCALRARGQME